MHPRIATKCLNKESLMTTIGEYFEAAAHKGGGGGGGDNKILDTQGWKREEILSHGQTKNTPSDSSKLVTK